MEKKEEESIALNISVNEEINRKIFELMELYNENNRSAVIRRAVNRLYLEEEKKRGKHEAK